jgi:hypothetical protein
MFCGLAAGDGLFLLAFTGISEEGGEFVAELSANLQLGNAV